MTDFKTVLVHVDHRDSCKARVELAARVARQFDGALVGAYLVPGLEITATVAVLLPKHVIETRKRELRDVEHGAEALFRQTAATTGVREIVWSTPAEPEVEAVIAMARASDLTVVGQAARNESDSGFFRELMETIVLAAGRPTLIVPFIGPSATMGEAILIAWNETREAARAVADALPILVRAKRVDIVTVDSGGNESGHARDDARLRAYLARHAVRVGASHRDHAEDVATGEWLLSRAADLGSDLVVMGAYAHARIGERILGGVTRTMLQSMTVPVLMSH